MLTINFTTGVGSAAVGLVSMVFLEGDATTPVKVMIIFDNENRFGNSVYQVELTLLQSGKQSSVTT